MSRGKNSRGGKHNNSPSVAERIGTSGITRQGTPYSIDMPVGHTPTSKGVGGNKPHNSKNEDNSNTERSGTPDDNVKMNNEGGIQKEMQALMLMLEERFDELRAENAETRERVNQLTQELQERNRRGGDQGAVAQGHITQNRFPQSNNSLNDSSLGRQDRSCNSQANNQRNNVEYPPAPEHPLRPREFKFTLFNKNEADGWFASFERAMRAARINDDELKLNELVAHLDARTIGSLYDVMRNLPEGRAYETLKREILARNTLSPEERLNRLFTDMTLDHRKPSAMLNEMLKHAEGEIPRDVVIRMWRNRLPPFIKVQLVNDNDEEVVGHADKVYKVLNENTKPDPHVHANEDYLVRTLSAAMREVGQNIVKATLANSNKNEPRRYANNESERFTPNENKTPRRPKQFESRTYVKPRGNTVDDSHANVNANVPGNSNPRKESKSDFSQLIDGLCRSHHNYGSKARYCNEKCRRYPEFTANSKTNGRSGN